MTNFAHTEDVRILLPQAALAAVFDECDRYDADETGGRVLGTYDEQDGKLTIKVTGIIEPGAGARRTSVSFFQDGEYQERVFRRIEGRHPSIEHLGNWHTHHVNGYPRLSDGDIGTYRRTVEHQSHNTKFFYALLVVAKNHGKKVLDRYKVKHYVFRRGDPFVYQVGSEFVSIVEQPLVWPKSESADVGAEKPSGRRRLEVRRNRVYDRDILGEFYQGVRPYMSKSLGVYWRGSLELIDGSGVEVVVLEGESAGPPTYTVAVRNPPNALKVIAVDLAERQFSSARSALIGSERICNRVLYKQRGTLNDQ